MTKNTNKFNIIENQKYFRYEINGEPGLKMLFTTRRGGASNGRYESLNMGYSTLDDKKLIYENRAIVLNEFNLGIDRMVSSDQIHGIKVVEVTDFKKDYGECDGLFTVEKNTVLCMYFADCTPLFFWDAKKRAGGLVHAGWRGTCNGIGRESINFMAEKYGSRPEDITVIIGPSIGHCCFEVGTEVAREFEEKLDKKITSGNITLKSKTSKESAPKYLINLKKINYNILTNCGISPDNILTHEICTCCRRELFFSYRRDNRDTGRMAGLFFIQ